MTENAPEPQPRGGPRPGDQNAPRPQANKGVKPNFVTGSRSEGNGSDDNQCYVVSRVDGLHIRERPDKDSRSDGHLDRGQALPASCEARRGRDYEDCGDRSYWWIPVPYKGQTDYVAWACVDWYTSDTGDDGNGGPGFG